MEEIKELLKLELGYVGKDGVVTTKEIQISVSKPSLIENKGIGGKQRDYKYKLYFQLTVPTHIFEALVGKTIPIRSWKSLSGNGVSFENLKHTLKAESIENLTASWDEVITCYKWLYDVENKPLKKVIFYDFDITDSNYKSDYDATPFGKRQSLKHKYCTGYIDDLENRYNDKKQSINKLREKEFYQLNCVDFSEEKELFFQEIDSQFKKLFDRVSQLNKVAQLSDEDIKQFQQKQIE